MRKVPIGGVEVSRVTIGGNQISGFSHQGDERSREMRSWFTTDRICDMLSAAEEAGINTLFARTDAHVISNLTEYWRRGGTIQWFAQVTGAVYEDGRPQDRWQVWLQKAADAGASALYLHGGIADYWYANGAIALLEEFGELARPRGRAVGYAGHTPAVHQWVRDNTDADFQMCCHYNPSDRTASPHHISHGESWVPEHRDLMAATIATIPGPVVHYKVFAGGNRPIREAFEFMGRVVRSGDVVLFGIFPKDDPDQLTTDIRLFEQHVEEPLRARAPEQSGGARRY